MCIRAISLAVACYTQLTVNSQSTHSQLTVNSQSTHINNSIFTHSKGTRWTPLTKILWNAWICYYLHELTVSWLWVDCELTVSWLWVDCSRPQQDLLRVVHTLVHVRAWRRANFQLLNKTQELWFVSPGIRPVWVECLFTMLTCLPRPCQKHGFIMLLCLQGLGLGPLYFKQSRQLQVSVTNKAIFVSTGVFEINAHP